MAFSLRRVGQLIGELGVIGAFAEGMMALSSLSQKAPVGPWVLGIVVLLVPSLHGQTTPPTRTVLIPDAQSCPSCTIRVQRSTVLGQADGPGSISGPPTVVKTDRLGRYWILGEGEAPMVFAASGKFLQIVGRRGEGPGEFAIPMGLLQIPGDSVLILDAVGPRATVVGPGLEPGRTVRLRNVMGPAAAAVDWPAKVILSGNVGSPEAAGWPLHLVSFAGDDAALVGSFGPDRGELRPGRGWEVRQLLSASNQAHVWSADWLRYRMSQWNHEGLLLRSVERKPEWFSQRSSLSIGNPTTPPPPAISAIQEDAEGLLWVFIRLASRTWREAWPAMPPGTSEVSANRVAFEKLFRTGIEVIDPKSARVITRRFLDEWIIADAGLRRVAAYSVDDSGVPHVSILNLVLLGR